jgi:hypothetical protein
MANGADLTPIADAVTMAATFYGTGTTDDVDRQVLKLGEEFGEVIEAWIGVRGANARKGVTHTWDDVTAELADVVMTALVAAESIEPGTSAFAVGIVTETAQMRRPDPRPDYITNRLLGLFAQCGKAAEMRSHQCPETTQGQHLRIVAAVALAIVAELGFDPAEAMTAKARKVSARIAEMGAAR